MVKEPWQQLGSDSLIVSRSNSDEAKLSESGNSTIHTIRDQYSGCALAIPVTKRVKDQIYYNFKHYMGKHAKNPLVVVKSDAAAEITGAVSELGWLPEPGIENKWPHNSVHERYQSTLKSVIRANMTQSGFPIAAWDHAAAHAGVALSVTQAAPIYPHEKDAAGNVLEDFKDKVGRTCWEVQHNNEPFEGPIQPFGRLCYYWDR